MIEHERGKRYQKKMSTDDFKTKVKGAVKGYCSVDAWKDRFPITRWLPLYKPSKGVSDMIAGLTVGLTVLPQGLAYASIAKLPLEVSYVEFLMF